MAKKSDTATTYADLLRQREEIEARIEEARTTALDELAESVRAQVAEAGFEINDLLSALQPKRARGKSRGTGTVAAKYRDPANGATWTGRGKKPLWVQAHLDAGGTLESLAI